MKVNILGTDYTIKLCRRDEDKKLKDNYGISGYCDFTTKKIVIANELEDNADNDDCMEDISVIINNVLRHEIVHATAYESGLDSSSPMRDEMIVDYIALQLPKMWKCCEEARSQLDKEITNNIIDYAKANSKKKEK